MPFTSLDIEKFNQNKKFPTPELKSYSVEKQKSFLGHQVRLNWEYEQNNIIGFKIWRAKPKQVSLKQEYIINQTMLERLSAAKSFGQKSTGLYNKQYFVQNSKVKFENSGSTRYDQKEETQEEDNYKFVEIGFVPVDLKDKYYQYIDKDVRFGRTYLYVLTAVNKNGVESAESNTYTINIEDLSNPNTPRDYKLYLGTNSVNICIDSRTVAEDVLSYKVYKRDVFNVFDDFKEVGEFLATPTNCLVVIDTNVSSGRKYEYKVFTKNFYGNSCLNASSSIIVYPNRFEIKQDIDPPEFTVDVDDRGSVTISHDRKNKKVIGLKIERKDVWKFDKGFSIKNVKGKPWKTLFPYDSSGSISFTDVSTKLGRSYQYRVTAIKKNSLSATQNFTSIFTADPGYSETFGFKEERPDAVANLQTLSVNVVDELQRPIYAEVSWNIEGEWDYLFLDIKNNNSEEFDSLISLKIDNIENRLKTFIDVLKPNNSYTITARVYKDDVLVDQSADSESEFTRVSVDI